MKYKNLYIGIIMLFLILPMVAAFDESLIKVPLKISWDRDNANNGRFIIKGENLDWSRTFEYNISNGSTQGLPNSWVEDLEIIIFRQFGNYTEVQYAIMECENALNFSSKWELCVDQRTDFELQIANEMINKTIYDEVENNLTIKYNSLESKYEIYKSNKDKEMEENLERIGELEQHRQWGWGIGVVGAATAIYLLNKYRGLGERKHSEQTEFPKDVAS